jgi:carbon storage regulator
VLVLTRRAGESIVIGDEVRVVVLEVRGDTVRLGIEAPRSVQVHRAEVYAEVQAANAAAASGSADLGGAAARLQQLARPRPPRQRGHARLDRGPDSRDPAGTGTGTGKGNGEVAGPAPAVPAPAIPAPAVPSPAVPEPAVPAPSVPAPSVPAPSVPAPSGPPKPAPPRP